jgi:hypothetical protein
MLAKMDASQKDTKAMHERMDANQVKADAHQAKMEANMGSMQDELISTFKIFKCNGQETTVCHEATEADIEKIGPDSGMMQSVAEHQEVPREDAEVMAVGGPKKRRRDRRHLAAGRRQKKQQDLVAARRGTTRRAAVARRRRIVFTKDATRELHGSRKRLVAARRGTKVAWQKRNQRLYESQNKKKPTAERRSRPTAGANAAQPLTVNGNASWSVFRRQLETITEQKQWSHREKTMCLVSSPKRRTADVLHGTMRDRRSSNWTLWRGRPPPKRKK